MLFGFGAIYEQILPETSLVVELAADRLVTFVFCELYSVCTSHQGDRGYLAPAQRGKHRLIYQLISVPLQLSWLCQCQLYRVYHTDGTAEQYGESKWYM